MKPEELGSVIETGYDYLHGEVRVWIIHNNLVIRDALPMFLDPDSRIHFYIEHEDDLKLRFMFYQDDQEKVKAIFKALEEKYSDWEDVLSKEDEDEL